jgi:hypothetical protein
MQNSDSRLRIPLATYFREQGLFENLKAARENSRFLDLCLRSGLKFPPFNLEHGGAMEYLMHSFKYAVAVAAYQNKELRGRFFPDISEQRSEPMAALSARMGILNALGQIGRSAVEGESDAAVARELGEELSAVVGVLFTLRLPRHATNR